MFRKVEFNKDSERVRFSHPLRLQVYPYVNERVPVIGGYSEVMMHFGLAGKPIEIALKAPTSASGKIICYSAQVYVKGVPFSSRITTGEAGFYYETTPEHPHPYGEYYCYADAWRVDPRDLFGFHFEMTPGQKAHLEAAKNLGLRKEEPPTLVVPGESLVEKVRAKISRETAGKTIESLVWVDHKDGYWAMKLSDGSEVCFDRYIRRTSTSLLSVHS